MLLDTSCLLRLQSYLIFLAVVVVRIVVGWQEGGGGVEKESGGAAIKTKTPQRNVGKIYVLIGSQDFDKALWQHRNIDWVSKSVTTLARPTKKFTMGGRSDEPPAHHEHDMERTILHSDAQYKLRFLCLQKTRAQLFSVFVCHA